MKSFAVLVFVGIVAAALGNPYPNCQFECTQWDITVCGHNDMCYNNFQSLCKMEEYNCRFPQKPFTRTDDWKCAEISLPQCTPGDMNPGVGAPNAICDS